MPERNKRFCLQKGIQLVHERLEPVACSQEGFVRSHVYTGDAEVFERVMRTARLEKVYVGIPFLQPALRNLFCEREGRSYARCILVAVVAAERGVEIPSGQPLQFVSFF